MIDEDRIPREYVCRTCKCRRTFCWENKNGLGYTWYCSKCGGTQRIISKNYIDYNGDEWCLLTFEKYKMAGGMGHGILKIFNSLKIPCRRANRSNKKSKCMGVLVRVEYYTKAKSILPLIRRSWEQEKIRRG